ncbi:MULTISPECIES: hypothetical protein [Halococcus]|uniref:hypothetical protein n=1 Tax=Halococcus TaxID=2249 RepID=UPI000E754CAF|nr:MULTISPECIES: hypothetical protein [Halococcus]RJT05278.1 hypothetical protein D3261_07810 [Halococcus sp. IIIV-5B]
MVTEIGLVYVVGMSLLFVFWAYGLVSFVLDVKHKFVPLAKQYLRGRRNEKEEAAREAEREEREQQLY